MPCKIKYEKTYNKMEKYLKSIDLTKNKEIIELVLPGNETISIDIQHLSPKNVLFEDAL